MKHIISIALASLLACLLSAPAFASEAEHAVERDYVTAPPQSIAPVACMLLIEASITSA